MRALTPRSRLMAAARESASAGARSRSLGGLDLHRQKVIGRRTFKPDPVFAGERIVAVDHGGDLRRKDIDAAHHHHIVAAADDAEARRGAPAARRAGPRQQDDVAGAEAHQRLALPADMGQHQLAPLALAPGQNGAGRGIDQLGMQHVQRHEMQVVVELALAREIAEDIGDAVIGVARREAPGRLQAAAEIGIVQAGFAAEQPEGRPRSRGRRSGKCSAMTRSSTAG